jgi:uncharacterized protein YndB with AHSA1/START domain
MSVEVPGTPEEVWAAIATGPGITSWFVPTEVDEGEGTVTLDFGPHGVDVSRVVASEPPHRFVAASPDQQFASEWLVEARDGGTCVVRLVQSGFGSDDQVDAVTFGWTLFFENLRAHLTHFRGEHATPLQPIVTVPGKADETWAQVCGALGLAPSLGPGDDFVIPSVAGRVTYAQATAYVAVIDQPLPGTAILACEPAGEHTMVNWMLYVYGDPGDVEAARTQWTAAMASATA